MNFEDFQKYAESNNGILIGYHAVPCPVYVVHVSYDSVDSDPFFPVYRAILEYVEIDPELSTLPYFSRLIGFDYELIKRCRDYLIENHMLQLIPGGTNCKITDDAQRKFINPNSKPTVRVSGNFLVDGKSLNLLPDVIYRHNRILSVKDDNVSAHAPVDPELDGAPFGRLIKRLSSTKTLQLLCLEPDGNNFEVSGVDKKFLIGAFAVYYRTHSGKIIKQIVYKNEQINCEAVGNPCIFTIAMRENDRYGWHFAATLGYNVGSSEDMAHVVIESRNEGWVKIVLNKYGVTNVDRLSIEFDEISHLPILIVSKQLFDKSKERRKLLDDCKSGMSVFDVSPNGKVIIEIQHQIDDLVDFDRAIDQWKSDNKTFDGDFIKAIETKFSNWRSLLVLLGHLDELESIDCARFISK